MQKITIGAAVYGPFDQVETQADRHRCIAGASTLELQFSVIGGAGLVEPWTGADVPTRDLAPLRLAAWERIKAERDRRKVLGVKVGAHWFHSDDSSRIQQLALMMMGASIPPGLQWKTLTTTPPPVFVTMTQALATGIFQATAASDAAIFQACEVHRVAMEASATPESYDFTGGWPASIEDGV